MTVPECRRFLDQLRATAGASDALAKAVRISLSGIMSEAVEEGWLTYNPVKSLSSKRGNKKAKRDKRAPQVGVDIPLTEEVGRLLAHMEESKNSHWLLLYTIAFTGLRISEARGLEWDGVDLKHGILTVKQRADGRGVIGSPKSHDSARKIPLAPPLLQALREAKLASKSALVFPSRTGTVQSHANLIEPALWRPQLEIKMVTRRVVNRRKGARDEIVAKYPERMKTVDDSRS